MGGVPLNLDDIFADTTRRRPTVPPTPDSGAFDLDALYGSDSASAGVTAGSSSVVAPAATPAPRRGIAGAVQDFLGGNRRSFGGGYMGGYQPTATEEASATKRFGLYGNPETRRPAPIKDLRTPEQIAADEQSEQRATISRAFRPDVTDAAGAAQMHGPSAARPFQSVAEDRNRRLQQRAGQVGQQQEEFSPEHWRTVAFKGAERANQLHAEGKHDEAQNVANMAYNAQLLSENSDRADRFGAIALSNLLGIVKDPYAAERRNIADIGAGGLTFTPEQQETELGMEQGATTTRGFDTTKDLVAPLVGQLPVIVAGGVAGRAAAGVAGGLAERAGFSGIGRAIGRIAQPFEEATALGPAAPVRTAALARTRIAEEVAAFKTNLPTIMARGATEGQAIGAIQAYQMARDQGASPEQAISAAAESTAISLPFGVIAELGMGAAGRAMGVGFDPVGRLTGGIADRIRNGPAVERPYDRRGEFNPEAARPRRMNDLGTALDDLLTQRRESMTPDERLEAAAARAPQGDESLIQPSEGFRPRSPVEEPNTPLPTAREAGLQRAGVEPPRPHEEANAFVQMQRAQEAARLQAEADANDPNLRLERAAQERPSEVQGPRTLAETIADVGPAAEQGEPLAVEYRDAVNKHADALATIRDLPEGKEPTTKQQIALARTRTALNDARKKYGAQFGASAVLALAAANDDLTDDEKNMVGLAAVPIFVTRAGLPKDVHAKVMSVLDKVSLGADTAPRRSHDWHSYLVREGVDQKVGPQIENLLEKYGRRKYRYDSMPLTIQDVRAALGTDEGGVITSEPLYSRLKRAVEFTAQGEPGYDKQLFPKKWDEPRPAGDWIAKLKGASTFSKSEARPVIARLEELAASKTKVSRDDILGMIEDLSPKIERVTLSEEGAGGGGAEGDIAAEDVDVDGNPRNVEDFDEVMERDGPNAIRQQEADRAARIREIEETITEAQGELESAKDSAEQHADSELYSIVSLLEQADIDDTDGIKEKIETAVREKVEPGYVPRDTVDHVMSQIDEDLLDGRSSDQSPEELIAESGHTVSDETETIQPEPEKYVRILKPNGEPLTRTEANERFGRVYRTVPGGDDRFPFSGGRSNEEHIKAVEESFGVGYRAVIEETTPEPVEHYVIRDSEGDVIWHDEDRDTLMQEFIDDKGLEPDGALDYETLRDYIKDYARAYSDYMEHESAHYSATEEPEEHFTQNYTEMERLREEITRLRDRRMEIEARAAEMARPRALPETTEEGAAPETDPLLEPITSLSQGNTEFHTYQRIGGGTNYRELVNTMEQNPAGENFTGGHHSGQRNNIGHIRVEDHTILMVPGLIGEKVEISADDPQVIRDTKSQIVEVRRQRDKLLKSMTELAQEYERLPENEKEGSRAHEIARDYASLNQRAVDFGKRDDELVKKFLNQHGALMGGDAPAPKPIRIMIESQSDWGQMAVKRGVKAAPNPQVLAELRPQYEELSSRINVLNEQDDTFSQRLRDLQQQWVKRRGSAETKEASEAANADFHRAMQNHEEAIYDRERGTNRRDNPFRPRVAPGEEHSSGSWASSPYDSLWSVDLTDLTGDHAALERDWMLSHPFAKDLANEYLDVLTDREAIGAQVRTLEHERSGIYDKILEAEGRGYSSKVPQSPFIEGGLKKNPRTGNYDADSSASFLLNVARFLLDSAEGGFDHIGWSDGANRAKNAHLPMVAAKNVYDEATPAGVKKLLGMLGFKDVPLDKVYIKGEGHWHLNLTPEMRKAIRKYGLPILGAMALAPDTAEAQGEGGAAGGNLYATAAGGIAAGAALMYLASSRKARRLVKENRELSRLIELDDLSGLANTRAFRRAEASVDRDPTHSWAVFDANQFKTLNDVFGHAEGDKAIQHYGQVIRDIAESMQIPMRGFRKGGDEFQFAVPKEKAAEFVRRVEEASGYTKGALKTDLTGAHGDTYVEADAMLNTQKEAARAADPTLRRDDRPRRPSGGGEGGFALHSNPIGPALRELARFPSAAALAGVGAVMADSDDEDIRRTGVPLMALAALSAVGSRRIAAGKDKLGKVLLDALSQSETGTAVARAFNPDALLHPDVREAIHAYEGDRSQAAARAAEMARKGQALGPQGDRAVSDVIEGEQWEDTSNMSADDMKAVLAFATTLDSEYQKAAKELVRTGARQPEELLPDYAGPRRYAYHDAQAAQEEGGPGANVSKNPRISAQKHRTLDEPVRAAQAELKTAKASGDPAAISAAQDKLDEAEVERMSKRIELGEIRESSYRSAQGIERAYSDAAAAKLFGAIRNVPGAVHPEWAAAIDDLKAAKGMQASAANQADRDAAKALVNDATVRISKLTRQFKREGGAYVALPDSRGLGELRGAVVKRDIAHSLTGFSQDNLYAKTLRAWKEIKTVFNPGTHQGNILSNIGFAHMEGLPMWEQPVYLKRAAQDMKKYGPATKALAEAGVLDHNAVNDAGTGVAVRDMRRREGLESLLGTTRPETADVLREQGITEEARDARIAKQKVKGAAAGAALGAAKMYSDEDPEDAALGAAAGAGIGALVAGRRAGKVRTLYNNEDNIFRAAIWLKKVKDGMTPEEATAYTRDALGNFRTRSPALHMLRSTVAPFVLYPAKALPRFASQVVDHPWRYAALIALWGGLNEYSQSQVGAVDEKDIPQRDRRSLGYALPGFTQLPFGNAKGEKAGVDVSRWTPVSGVTTGAPPGSLPASLNEGIPDIFRPGGPAVDAAAKFGVNVDPFSAKPFLQRDYPASENIGKLANGLAGTALPSVLDFQLDRVKGDIENRDWDKLKNDMLGPTGLRPRFVRPGSVTMDAQFQLKSSLMQMKQDYKRDIMNNQNRSRDKVLFDRYLRRVQQALHNFRERSGLEPSTEVVRDALDMNREN